MILDVYWSFFIGLGNFDPIRAMDFHARPPRASRHGSGDPKRRALSLAAEAVTRAVSGGESAPSAALIEKARTLCDGLHAPEYRWASSRRWRRCAPAWPDSGAARSASADGAEHFLSEECSGVAWERATSIQVRSTGVFHLGQWATEYGVQRFPAAIAEARARGDVHAMVAHIPAGTMAFLVADEPVLAEQFIRDTIAALPRNRFLMPNVYVFALKVYVALYTGDARTAWSSRRLGVVHVDGFSFPPGRVSGGRGARRTRARRHCAGRGRRSQPTGRCTQMRAAALTKAFAVGARGVTVDSRRHREHSTAATGHGRLPGTRRTRIRGGGHGALRRRVSLSERVADRTRRWPCTGVRRRSLGDRRAVANPQKIFDMLAPGLWTASRIPQRS
jgi:hypothetical protein